MLKKDIILALNKVLVRLCRINYLQSRAILSFLTKEARAEDLLNI